jgi:hypothetical protein
MLVAAMAPNATLLIDRILNAPFVPPVQAGNGKIPCLVPGSGGTCAGVPRDPLHYGTGEFAAITLSKLGVVCRAGEALSLYFQ